MENINSRIIFIFDLVIIYLAFFVVHMHYRGQASISPMGMLLMGAVALSWFFISINSRILKVNRKSRVINTIVDIIVGYSVLTTIIIVLVAVFGNFRFNDKIILYSLLISVSLSCTYRLTYILTSRHLVKNGYQQKSVIIIGGGTVAERVLNRITSSPELGYRLHGILSDDYHEALPKGYYLGDLGRFKDIVRTGQIDEVIIAKPLRKEKVILKLVEQCEEEGVRFHIVPDFFRIIRNRAVLNTLGDIPLIAIRTEPLNILSNRLIKRSFDICAASALILLLLPLFIILGLLIKLTSRGPVFFKQTRVGANNREFEITKFRSMEVQGLQDSDTTWTTQNDQRVTVIGLFMRRYNLDELPQLWNVFIGNMSLVGPRPERSHFVEQFRKEIPGYKVRHLVKSGITGWAQVNGWRGDTSIKKRVEHDIWYIENWSLWLDLKILWLTLFSRKAYRNAY